MPIPSTPSTLRILENQPLKPFTTFKIGGPARYFAHIGSCQELLEALKFARSKGIPVFVLGGGSNVLISDEGLDALALHPSNEGISLVHENAERIGVSIEAAEPWDRFVACAVQRNWWGVENLSHIPGQTGAALVQNIGAYGQQISDVLESAEVIDLATGETQTLLKKDLGLAYRRSIFNTTHKGRYFIARITLKLSREPRRNLAYSDVRLWFEKLGVQEPSLDHIRQAIIAIRDRKFPFQREEKGGNAGSFFKNLILNEKEYKDLEHRFQAHWNAQTLERLRAIRNKFPESSGIKIPTAFLIEVCGLKGLRVGGAQVNEAQPLVILNQGGATARDVLTLARRIRQTIYAKMRLRVDIEPELVGFSPETLNEFLAFE
ncbi:MAG TPA: UDP-N-acetylmuramate dehydrogenase [Terriglobia bacterium]|nr:UDP-N-acetylmuramate dehydrogenase [Terriglobia bacterium]